MTAARGFAVTVMLTLALGVGLNGAMFSVVRTLLLDGLPYPSARQLVAIAQQDTPEDRVPVTASYPTFLDWQGQSQSFSSMAAYGQWTPTMQGPAGPERLAGMRVSRDFFRTLAVAPTLGRDFVAGEDTWDARDTVVIVDHGFWQGELGGAPDVIGRELSLSGHVATVVGVLPPSFRPLGFSSDGAAPRVWAPLGYEPGRSGACRTCQHLRVVGRLADGVDIDTARAELHGIQQRLASQHPDAYGAAATARVRPLNDVLVGALGNRLRLLFAAAILVMCVVCANIAGIFAARAIARRHPLAVHAALGASRVALFAHVLREAALVSVAGAALGLALGMGALEALKTWAPDALPRLDEITIDPVVAGYTIVLSLATSLLAASAAALRAWRVDPIGALRSAGAGGFGAEPRLQRMLVAGQVAAAIVVACAGGLLLRSFVVLADVDPGFDPHGVITARTMLIGERYDDDRAAIAHAQAALVDRLYAAPGVTAAAVVSTLPLYGFDRSGLHVRGAPPAPPGTSGTDVYRISPDYLAAMGIPLLAGRGFDARDHERAAPVVLVSRSLADAYWPGEDAVGKHLRIGGNNPDVPWSTVVGVVADVRQYGLDEPVGPQTYLPIAQSTSAHFHAVVRSSLASDTAAAAIRDAMRAVDPSMPVYGADALDDMLAGSLATRRLAAWLLGSFALLSAFLAAVGIYGVLAQSLGRRRREIALRAALGAGGGTQLRWAMRNAALPLAIGTVLGIAAALVAARALGDALVGISPHDPAALAGGLVLVVGCGAAASLLSATRALRASPGDVLRED